MIETIQPYIQDLLILVVTALGAVLTKLIAQAGSKALAWMDANVHSATFKCATEKLTEISSLVVVNTEATMVRDLKAASADGKLTAEEGRQVMENALAEAKEFLGEKGLAELQECLGHAGEEGKAVIDRLLKSHIESRLSELKARLAFEETMLAPKDPSSDDWDED